MSNAPDFEAKARELYSHLVQRGGNNREADLAAIAAALRQAADEALERAADCVQWADEKAKIRFMKSPAAAPAAETCRAECASRMPDYSHYECTLPKGHGGAHREGGTEWTDKDTVVSPPSEPVAPQKATGFSNADKPFAKLTAPAEPSLLPRVLAALEEEANAHDEYDSRYEHARAVELRALAAELRQYIAEMGAGTQPDHGATYVESLRAGLEREIVRREKRIAELEVALAPFVAKRPVTLAEWKRAEALLAARAAPPKGEGT